MNHTKRNPAGGNGGARKSTWAADYLKHSDRRTQSPSVDDLYESSVVLAATDLGFTVAVPCQVCGHMLTSARSVATHVGPRCATKVAAND